MDRFADIGIGFIVLAGVALFTRPGSQGWRLLHEFTSGFQGSLAVATFQKPPGK